MKAQKEIVYVSNKRCDITVYHTSANDWEAVGYYMAKSIRVTGKSRRAASIQWVKVATLAKKISEIPVAAQQSPSAHILGNPPG